MADFTLEQQRALAIARARMRVQQPTTQPAPTPAPEEEEEEPGILSRIGATLQRGAGRAISGFQKPIEEAPEIIGETVERLAGTIPVFSPGLRIAAPAVQAALRAGAPGFRETVAPVSSRVGATGRAIEEQALPRATKNLEQAYEEGGVPGALLSLAETVGESAAPTIAGIGTALVTRSPTAAAAVMGLGTAPQTYTGIRERQAEEGIDDVGRALVGTAASSALDVLTGVGGRVTQLGREAAEGVLRTGVTEAAKRVASTGAKESGTEVLQTVIEQVAGGSDPTTKAAMLESLEAGLAGALGGVAFGGVAEGARAVLPEQAAPSPGPIIQEGAPPEIIQAPAITTIEMEDIEGQPARLEILSAPDEIGNVWVRDQAGGVSSVPRNILERMGATFEPVAEAPPIPPAEAPPVGEPVLPPVEEPGITAPPVAPPTEAPSPPTPPAPPTPGAPPTTAPGVVPEALPVTPEPAPEPMPAPEPGPPAEKPFVPFQPAEQPTIQDDATRDYWSSNLARQRGQLRSERLNLVGRFNSFDPEDTANRQPVSDEIDVLDSRIREIDEDIAGLEQGVAPVPRARPLDDFTAKVADQADRRLADAVRDLPATNVMDWFAQNATTDFHRALAQKVGNMMRAMENAGFQFNWGVYDQNFKPRDDGEKANYNYVMKGKGVKGAAWTHSQAKPKFSTPAGGYDKVDIGVKGPDFLNSGANEVIILHEFAHAVTVAAIQALRSKKLSPNSRVGKAIKDLQRLKVSAVKHKNKILKDMDAGKPVDPRLAQAIRNLEASNAWQNEKELIVQGLSNIDMQIVLKSLPYQETNGFVEFIRQIGRLIGVSETDMNGLRRLFELTDVLLPSDTAQQQEVIQAMTQPTTVAPMQGPAPSAEVEAEPEASIDEFTFDEDVQQAIYSARKVPSLSRRVDRLVRELRAGRITDQEFIAEVSDWSDYLKAVREGKVYRKQTRGRQRGADYIRQRLLEAKRRGDLTPEAVDFAEWFIQRNPALVDELGISMRKPKADGRASGYYDVLPRLMTLMKGAANDSTVVHEIMHHLERIMPEDIQEAIRTSWKKAFDRASKKAANQQEKDYFAALEAYHNRKTFLDNRDYDIAMEIGAKLPYDFYQYMNPSEFWAVNATDIMQGRYDVQGSTLGRLKGWLRDLGQKIKGLFGLPSKAPILKALDSLSNADGKFQSLGMLQNANVTLSDVAREGAPSPANTETQSRVGDVSFDQRNGIGQVPMNENVDYFGFTAIMRPSKFLELAASLRGEEKQPSIDYIESQIREGKPVGSPFLEVDFDTGRVTGHEGRHRMMAIQRVNGDAPVPVHMFGKGEQRARNLNPDKIARFREMLKPEDGGVSTGNFDEAFLSGNVVAPEVGPTAPTAAAIGEEPTAPASTEAGEPDVPAGAVNAQGRPYVQISLGDEKRLDRYRRYWADRMRRLGFVEEAIEKATGHPIPRAQRPTEKASLFESRANERLEDLEKDHLKKITDFLRDEGVSPNEADLFLLARTAQDRNAKIARRNPEMPDAGSGLSNAEAQAILLEFITDGRIDKMQRLAELVDAMTQQTRDTLVSYGMLTQEQADALVRDEPFYVPLKGLALDGDMSVTGDRVHREPGSGRGFSISRKEFKAAKGRSSLPFSPLANAMADAQAAIIRGERNRVGQSFLNDIARKYDSNAWQVFTEDNPDKQTVYNSKTKQVEERPVSMDMFPDRYFVVKEDGKPYYIKINDPLLMRALVNGSSKDFAYINKILGASIGAVTRTMSRLFTTFNPEFFIPNFARDIEAAIFNILAEQDAVDGRVAGQQILKNTLKDIGSPKNIRAIFNATFGRDAQTPEQQALQDLFNQARKDGAFTGWIMTDTPQEQVEKIQRTLTKASGVGGKRLWYSTVDGAGSVLKAVEDFNSVFENVTRFAVYKNALDAGVTRDEAAGMSRNVTVDFNKKGEVGPTANALYAFFNAAVRGNAQLLRSLTAKSRDGKFTRAQKLAAGLVVLGIVQTVVGRAISDEDEDGMLFYDKIPDWEKQRNLIIMQPDGRDYLKIPLPYGYSFFHTLGTLGADVQAGIKTAGDMGVGIVSGMINNFAPVQISGQSLGGIAISTVPTALKPLGDLLINENFFGSPIYNEPFDENQALSSVSRFSTPEGYKAIATFLNEVTGGKGIVKGAVDVPAEAIDYLVNTYIGGAGKFGVDAINLAAKATKGDEVEIREVPVLRKVMGEPNQQADLGMYFDRINQISPVQRQLKDSRGEERAVLLERYPVETNYRVIKAMEDAKRDLRELNKQKRVLLDRDIDPDVRDERLDALNKRQRNIYIRFNKIYNAVEKQKGAQ